MKYEYYQEKFQITARFPTGEVKTTKSLGCDWFHQDEISGNKSWETNIMFVAASDDFANTNMTVRKAEEQ